jgi:hypothetical protein
LRTAFVVRIFTTAGMARLAAARYDPGEGGALASARIAVCAAVGTGLGSTAGRCTAVYTQYSAKAMVTVCANNNQSLRMAVLLQNGS